MCQRHLVKDLILYRFLVFHGEKLVEILDREVLPSFVLEILLELFSFDRVRVLAEHAVIEIVDDSIENSLILIHLSIVVVDVDWDLATTLTHFSLHLFKNSGQIAKKEDRHANVLVDKEHSVSHFGLDDPVKHRGLRRVKPLALEATD